MDDDEDTQPPQVIKQPQQVQQPKTSDPFDILGLDIGTPTQPKVVNTNNGGDLLGGFSFGNTTVPATQPQPIVNQNKGFDSLLDDGFLGGGSSTVKQTQPAYSQPQTQTQSLGFDFLGTGSTGSNTNININLGGNTQPVQQPTQPTNQFSFQQQPQQQQQQNFKFKAYETAHVEIWLECKKENDGNTRINASFMNKTHNYIEQLNLQTAVMKYLKIAIQPMSGTSLPPNSKGAVTQVMTVTNSLVGQKPIVMKIKLSYFTNGEKYAF